jgi:hypothetical protein
MISPPFCLPPKCSPGSPRRLAPLTADITCFKLNGEAPALNPSALPLGVLSQQGNARPHRQKAILLRTVLGPVITVAMVISAILAKARMKRRAQERKAEQEWDSEYGPPHPSATYKDIFGATGGFKDQMPLGRGGFGSVFRGVLPRSKQAVAIKRVSPESKQGMKEFMAEIIILGHLRHRNLVQLLGYCRHKQQLLLVYDYIPNRSLDCFLHGQENTTNGSGRPNWAQRLCVTKGGVASGLLYLHEEWEQVIIHWGIKSSNVLLDAEMNARLGDFRTSMEPTPTPPG